MLILLRRSARLLKQSGHIQNALGEHGEKYPIPYETAPNLKISGIDNYRVKAQDGFGFKVIFSSAGDRYDPVWAAKGLRQGQSPGKARTIAETVTMVVSFLSGIATIATTIRYFMGQSL